MTPVPDFASLPSSDGMGPIGRGCATYFADGWRRLTDIGARFAGRAMMTALELALNREGGEDLLRHALHGSLNYMTEMASVPALAFNDAVTQYERARATPPVGSDNVRLVDGKPIMLPLRFAEASQGWAIYLVDAVKAQAALGHYAGEFQICQLNGQAALVIYGMDFRQTDLGAYHEVGVEFLARPKANPTAMPGMVVTRMVVDSAWSARASNAIWSFEKLLAPRMQPSYHRHSVEFPVDDADPNTLAITLPRFGSHRSTEVPLRYFTVDHSGGPRHGQPLCTVFRRSARGEGVQFDGDVRLRLGNGDGQNCFCAIGTRDRDTCTCKALQDMGLPRLRPVANGWAEHVTGQVDAAFAIAPPPAHQRPVAPAVSPAETPPAAPQAASSATPTSPSPRRRTARRQA